MLPSIFLVKSYFNYIKIIYEAKDHQKWPPYIKVEVTYSEKSLAFYGRDPSRGTFLI